MIKFRYFEKATKFEKNLSGHLTLLSTVKKLGDFSKFCGLLKMSELYDTIHYLKLNLAIKSKYHCCQVKNN